MQNTHIEYGDNVFTLTGPQLHSKDMVQMTCKYRRDGLPARFIFSGQSIEATIPNLRSKEERGLTVLGNDEVSIRQVEHILSALYGMQCLDTDIHLKYVDTAEATAIAPPVGHLDAKDFTLAIRRSFLNRQPRPPIELDKVYVFEESSSDRDKSLAVFAPFGALHVSAHVNFPYFWGKQIAAKK